MKTVLIAIVTGGLLQHECIESVYNQHLDNENIRTKLKIIRGYNVDESRNNAVKIAIEQNYDYLFFVDDDQILKEDTIQKLLHWSKYEGYNIITTWTSRKKAGYSNLFNNESGSFTEEHNLKINDLEKLIENNVHFMEVTGVGMSGILIKTSVFKEIANQFNTMNIFQRTLYHDGNSLSEDLNFCMKAKRCDFKILAILGQRIGHIDKILL